MSSSLNRTNYPKYTTYWGDGNGRDQYVVFNNGGLHDLRDFKGPQGTNGFNLGPNLPYHGVTPKKDASAFDYVPDGTGRDTYIIKGFGLKRDYKSDHREHEKSLRMSTGTPVMDARQMYNRSPFKIDATMFNNWPSPKAVKDNSKMAVVQRESIDRLSQSPQRCSPMSKYLNKTSTFDLDPKERATPYLQARAASTLVQGENQKPMTTLLQDTNLLQYQKVSLPAKQRDAFTSETSPRKNQIPRNANDIFFSQVKPKVKTSGNSNLRIPDGDNHAADLEMLGLHKKHIRNSPRYVMKTTELRMRTNQTPSHQVRTQSLGTV